MRVSVVFACGAVLACLGGVAAAAGGTGSTFGGARFVVPSGYERSNPRETESATYVLETVERTDCVITVLPGYPPVDTLVREFAAVWQAAHGADAKVPEPRRASSASGARYVEGGGAFASGSAAGTQVWLYVVDFDERQRHHVTVNARDAAQMARCRRDADALVASLRAEPGYVPVDLPAPAAEPSVEDLLLLNGKADAVELLWCESHKKQRQSCPADTSAGVLFVGRASFAECEEGKSYWVEDGAIVVDKGCRARFAVRAAAGAESRGERFACESFLKDSIYCDGWRIDRGVRIGRVLSRAPCVWNESWGVLLDDLGVNSYVWVANGCRAEFHRW